MNVRHVRTDEPVNTNGDAPIEETLINHVTPESICAFRQEIDNLSIKGRTICNILLQSPTEFLGVMGLDRLKHVLRDSGWKRGQIRTGLREIREMLRQNA